MKRALITGVAGQDGSYLTELLLSKGYEVHGIIRRASTVNTGRIDHLFRDPAVMDVRFFLHYGDMTDSSSLSRLLEKIRPDEIYNLGAQSDTGASFEMPEYTANADAVGVLRLLDALKEIGLKSRFFQSSTSELFGSVQESPQNENTPFHPCSPYAVSKLFGYWIVRNYRESYGMFAANGILFNHASPRRAENFVTRKITMAVARIHRGLQDCLHVGNINARRDWGYAKDYVKMIWTMLQQEKPDDYIIATGETHSVREFIESSFAHVGRPIEWRGQGLDESGIDTTTGKVVVRIDPHCFRPADVDELRGDPAKAHRQLGWVPEVRFEELVRIMTDGDLRLLDHPVYETGF